MTIPDLLTQHFNKIRQKIYLGMSLSRKMKRYISCEISSTDHVLDIEFREHLNSKLQSGSLKWLR